MALLVQYDKYGSMNTTYSTKMGYYVINCFSQAYTLQEDTTCDGKISTSGELVIIAHYLKFMQEKTKCYWEQKNQQQVIVFLTHTIIYPCIDVMAVK